MFTFSFGSAMATIPSADAPTAGNYVDEVAATYLDGDFAAAATAYVSSLGYDADGKLTKTKDGDDVASLDVHYVQKSTIVTAAEKAAYNAEVKFLEIVAAYKAAILADKTAFDAATKTEIIAGVKTIFDAVVAGSTISANTLTTSYPSSALDFAAVGLTDAVVLDSDNTTAYERIIKEQRKIDVDAAQALLGTDTSLYSDNLADWALYLTDSTGHQTVNNKKYNAIEYTYIDSTSTISYHDVLGDLTYTVVNGVDTLDLTARDFMKALIAKQRDTINKANATLASISTAKKYLDVLINGHKIGGTYGNFYVEKIPTYDEIKADTTLDGTKATAVAKSKAALALAQINLSTALQEQINALNKKAKLTAAEKETLATLEKQKADLSGLMTSAEEFYVANINYQKSVAAVNTLLGATRTTTTSASGYLGEIEAFNVTATGLNPATGNTLETLTKYDTIHGWVNDLKAEAALRATQKDVDGQPYYDAEILAANLEDAIEYTYDISKYDTTADANGTTYTQALAILDGSAERTLIETKIKYINFIKSKAAASGIKDSKGKTLTTPWNDPDAKANTAKANDDVKALHQSGAADTNYVVSGVKALYDKAQKAELKALIDETKKAIEDAKTVDEVKKIFVEANDKYEAIATTEDHLAAWNSKVGAAYTKAEYDKELLAYANYFVQKNDMTKYPSVLSTGYGILKEVAYPVVYKAYTVEELADKVAEAKAAIDAIKTVDQVKADKKAMEDMIAALPEATAVALTDKDAIVAAADALKDYKDIPGALPIANESKLTKDAQAYEELLAKDLDAAYKALKYKTITTADAQAVKELRDMYDAWAAFVADYNNNVETSILSPTDDAEIKALEKKLSDAKVAEVKAMLIKLPANPRTAQKAEVEAARAAYEALELKEKDQLVDSLPYKNLIDAEEALGLAAIGDVQTLKLTAKSTAKKGSITIKWTAKGVAEVDGYQVWKSTKANKGFKKAFTTKKTSYKNTKGLKKGKTYYYKVRAYKVVDGKNVYSDWSNKAYRKAK